MLLVMLVLAVMSAAGGFYLKTGRARSLRRLERDVLDDVRRRLESVASEVGGRIAEGPSLRSGEGVMTLVPSRAPQSMVIDLAKFTGPVDTPHELTLVRTQDARRGQGTRFLRPVTLGDSAIEASYSVLASSEAFARTAVTRELVRRLQELDRDARVRTRLHLSHGKATITAGRGLSRPDELKAFHDGSAAILACLRASLNDPPS